MAHSTISVSLAERDIAFLDREASGRHFASRSAVVHEAVRLLRESRLADAYAEAFSESDDDHVWSVTTL